eukprot:SAG11_NODE_29973_length_305_cov_0.995146_1_plen_77_part_10
MAAVERMQSKDESRHQPKVAYSLHDSKRGMPAACGGGLTGGGWQVNALDGAWASDIELVAKGGAGTKVHSVRVLEFV